MSFRWKAALGTRTVRDKHVITKREKTVRKRWIVTLGILALALAIGGWAEAQNTCLSLGLTGGRVSSSGPAAATIGASGFDDPTCDLFIDVTIPVSVNPLTIRAHDITIGPIPPGSGVVEIINNAANSVTTLTATETDLVISEASIKAHKTLRLICQGTTPDCNITSRLSDLIAALNFANPTIGGDLFITAEGSVDIQTTNTHGGNILEINAKHGSLTLLCGPGEEAGCRDPVLSSKAVELCDTTGPGGVGPPDGIADFPCTVNFLTGADLTAVCFRGVPGVKCNGGSKEKRFTAQGDIDITGSTITAIDHVTFTSKAGRWLAAGANLSAESIVAVIKGDGTSPSIDLSDATINTTAHTSITAGTGCIAPVLPLDPADTCINANGATINASNIVMLANVELGVIDVCEATLDDTGADHPTLNGDSTPPYDDPPNRVVDTALECTDFAGKGPLVVILP
jgi:hypothetical protein